MIIYLETRFSPDINRKAYTPAQEGSKQDIEAYIIYSAKRDGILKQYREMLRGEGLRENATLSLPDLTERERQLLQFQKRALDRVREEYMQKIGEEEHL